MPYARSKTSIPFPFSPSPASSGEAAPQAYPGVSDFGSLEFDKYDDFNILARRISEVTADITESMSQLSGSIHRAQDDMGSLQQLTLGMRDEIARAPHGADRDAVHALPPRGP
jgi:chemosensory pili system protein ChpA (sensor histidine kinase/response regulator)